MVYPIEKTFSVFTTHNPDAQTHYKTVHGSFPYNEDNYLLVNLSSAYASLTWQNSNTQLKFSMTAANVRRDYYVYITAVNILYYAMSDRI